ncbi:class I SAM-dependent methyltransferase [Microbacterium paludicola]|uniref:Class I SAM-dependent methyltransferase n=1 Tax=Microbacterium paludicola TaxID=300019 RepID=A0A4Y9FWC4_9MICO|nr:class I SAM-dependent methyltransferase [Microbacterium paludicola]MBF0815804.1 class I SAM-dependent methyltransferase [Microbacterium paludicola]TFU33632.1 class I SAM-dependent methyltransferase [Microbacterium paludicola]
MSDDIAEIWSAAADDWSTYWAASAQPVWPALLDGAAVAPGARVLDVGCGSGQLLAHLESQGFAVAGTDPAPRMVELAREHAPGADVRLGGFEALPFPDGAFDAVLAVNSLQFAEDHVAALREAARVLAPGGAIGVASWAETSRNDIETVEDALAAAHDEEPGEDPDYRLPGGLEAWLTDAGLHVVAAGTVDVTWEAQDDGALVRGILFGEDDATIEELAPVVREASAPFRTSAGGYRFANAFRFAVGRP